MRIWIANDTTGWRSTCRVASIACACVLVFGCSKNDDDRASDSAEPPASKPVTKQPRVPSARATGVVWRSLLDEAGRAELDVGGQGGGLIIDFGTADQHKYTRGGWRTGWGDGQQLEGVTVSQVRGDRAVLDLVLSGEVRELQIRARALRPGLVATAYVGSARIGELALSSDWQTGRIPVAQGVLTAGRQTLVLRFARPGAAAEKTAETRAIEGQPGQPAADPVAEFDWLWLARTAGAQAPTLAARVMPMAMAGQPRRALIASTSRTYSFYLQPHADSQLVFDYGSMTGAIFSVSARADSGKAEQPARQLFSAAGSSAWQEASVDLSGYAGQAIQLSLSVTTDSTATAGPDKNQNSGWGEPIITRTRATERPRKKIARRPRNAILLVLDTTRADVYGPFASGTPIHTPSFDRFAGTSAVFVNAYNNENWTKPSVATTLSALYPSTHDTKRDGSVLPAEVELLPEHLQKQGFRTAGFVANGYISEYFGFEKGWHEFINYIRDRVPSEAERVFQDARQFISEHRQKHPDEPFFAYIQTIDPHVVYDVPETYSQRYYGGKYKGFLGSTIDAKDQVQMAKRARGRGRGNDDRHTAWLRALYYGEVTYNDHHLGKFLSYLADSGALDDTLVVITNDHGEELGERGYYGHGHSLYQEMIRAPLVMHYPGIFAPGTQIPDIVENVDIAPTILDALDLPPMADAEGRSLLPVLTGAPVERPDYAIAEFLDGRRFVRVGRYTFMRSVGKWMHLFDIDSDPEQRVDLIDSHPIARRLCEIYLGEGLAVPDKRKRRFDLVSRRRLAAGKAKVSPGVRRQLSALGYFGDSEDRSEDDASD